MNGSAAIKHGEIILIAMLDVTLQCSGVGLLGRWMRSCEVRSLRIATEGEYLNKNDSQIDTRTLLENWSHLPSHRHLLNPTQTSLLEIMTTKKNR